MSAHMTWYGKLAIKLIIAIMVARVHKATKRLHVALKTKVSGTSPSSPGNYPGMITGEFRDSIEMEFNKKKIEGRVGSNHPKAAWLEFGTHRMAARPWLTLITEETKSKLKGVMLRRSN